MKPKFILWLVVAICLSAAGGYFAARTTHPSGAQPATASTQKIKLYQSPMHPWITSDKPGKCTICGMDLVPVYEGDASPSQNSNLVTLSTASATVVGVQTAEVRRGTLVRTLRVTGVLDDDETRHRIVSAHVPGRIEKLFVNQIGEHFEAGAPLATLYSPEIQTAQRLYLERIGSGNAFPESDKADARERLLTLGLDAEEITHLEKNRTPSSTVTIHAPFAGTVVARGNAYEGQYVETHDKLFEIGDLSHLWFIFDAYESDLPWLKLGQTVEITTPSRPGETFRAPIAFIDPNTVEATRTARVRVVVANSDGKLLHRQTATGRVSIEQPEVTLVPRSAVLFTRGQPVAYLDRTNQTYEPRSLKLGRVGDDAYEVVEGLKPGDRVVSQGALLVDSQAQLAHTSSTQPDTIAAAAKSTDTAHSADVTALQPLVLASADAASALAADDLPGYQKILPELKRTLAAYIDAFPDAKNGPLAQLGSGLKSGPDLKTVRASFEVFSHTVAGLAQAAHFHHRGIVKIFQCPMSPVLGTARWVQRNGELRNPFFGSAMLECGEEIR